MALKPTHRHKEQRENCLRISLKRVVLVFMLLQSRRDVGKVSFFHIQTVQEAQWDTLECLVPRVGGWGGGVEGEGTDWCLILQGSKGFAYHSEAAASGERGHTRVRVRQHALLGENYSSISSEGGRSKKQGYAEGQPGATKSYPYDKKVPKRYIVLKLFAYTKSYRRCIFKRVNYMALELYFNKAV